MKQTAQPGVAKQLKVTLPGDWIALDAIAIAEPHDLGELPDDIASAVKYLELAAALLNDMNVVYAGILARPETHETAATMASYVVPLPRLDDAEALVKSVRANPPKDAVEGTVKVRSDKKTGRVRLTCQRRSVLEVPSQDSVSFAVEYFVPIPDSSNMLVTGFSTPNTRDADEYAKLFESIVAAFEFV
jgi:hypothetical protein